MDTKPSLFTRATDAAMRALYRWSSLRQAQAQQFSETGGTNTRATGRYVDAWFDPRYIKTIQKQPSNPIINNPNTKTVPGATQQMQMMESKSFLLREKLFTTFQGGALRFLPMDDGVTEETPEMRSEYIKILLKEPSVKSAMLSKVISVVSSKMSMLPASDDATDKLVANWTEHTLTRSKGGIRKIGENILLFALTNGHSLNEKIYEINHSKKFQTMFPQGYIGLKTLKVKKPEDYKLEVDQFRNIKGVWSNRASRRFDPSYFVISSFMPMYENPAGTSDLRAAIRSYNLLTLAQQLRAIWCEQFSLPIMEGTYPEGDNDAKQYIEAAIQHVRALGWYVVPNGTTIRAIETSVRGDSEFQAMIDDLRKEIYLCIVGSYLQAIEGDTVGGAGNSETHRSTFELFQWYLCEFLAEQINDQIIPDLVGLNFSGMEPPRVSFAGVTDGDLLQSAAVYQAIKTLGLDLSKKKLREKFQIDAPADEADAIKGGEQQPAGGLPGAGGGDPNAMPGAAPDPLAALKMAEGTPVGERFQDGAKVLWTAMKYMNAVKLTPVALAREMCIGEDGLTDFGTLMRTAKYHGVEYKDIENPSVFDLEDDINDVDRLVITTLTNPTGDKTSFALVTQCRLAEGYVTIHNADGQEQLDPETFLSRWPGVTSDGKPASRRAVVLSKKREEAAPAPTKNSDGDDSDKEEERRKSGVLANKPAVTPSDMPAGPDGKDVYRLLNQCQQDGADAVAEMAKKAATRMLKSGKTDTFFNDDELAELAETLEEYIAPADLMGRASILIRLEKAREKDIERFSDMPCGIAKTFAEARIKPMKPASALNYFKSLVPSMNLNVTRWGDSLRRKTFTMAEATNKKILDKVQKAITQRTANGMAAYGPEAVEDVLVKAGIHPKNPQYAGMVFRTNYMDALNVAAEEQRLDPDVMDEFPVWKYMGIRDGRQGKDHEEHFGKYFSNTVKFHEVRGERVFNCRCQAVPVYKGEWSRLKAKGSKVTKFAEQLDELITRYETDVHLEHVTIVDDKIVKLSEVQYAENCGANPLFDSFQEEKPVKHDYCSTQFNLPHAFGLRVMGEADRIKDEDLAEKGREDEPHITVLYGIHDDSCLDALADLMKDQKPILARLRKTVVFEKDDCDVIVLPVESPELHELREKIEAICPNTQTYPDYQPHVTLAYVKKGLGDKYVSMPSLDGLNVKLADFCFCGTDESKTQFKLGGDASKFAEIYTGPNPPGDRKNWQAMQPGPRGGKRWKRVTKASTPAAGDKEKIGGSRFDTMSMEQMALKLKPTKQRALSDKPPKTKLSKQETGRIGEQVALSWLQAQGIKDVKPMTLKKNEKAVDMVSKEAGLVIEAKAGYAGNSSGAQQWRLTIGEPGEEEKAWLAKASPEQKAKYNAIKQRKIHERKQALIMQISKEVGRKIQAITVTAIINPDTNTADVYRFEGLHDRIGWKSEVAQKGYQGSFTYGK